MKQLRGKLDIYTVVNRNEMTNKIKQKQTLSFRFFFQCSELYNETFKAHTALIIEKLKQKRLFLAKLPFESIVSSDSSLKEVFSPFNGFVALGGKAVISCLKLNRLKTTTKTIFAKNPSQVLLSLEERWGLHFECL